MNQGPNPAVERTCANRRADRPLPRRPSTRRAKLSVLSIQALNATALWFSSALALQGRMLVFAVGGVGILACTGIAFRLIAAGRRSAAMGVSAGTLPALLVVAQFALAAVAAPLAVLPALAVLAAVFASVVRHARRRLAASGASLSGVPLLLESRFTVGEWLALLSGSAAAGYSCLLLYRHFHA